MYDSLRESRQLAISGYVLASALEAAERGNGHTITDEDLCIPGGSPTWLTDGIKQAVGVPVMEIPVP